jgi:ABC-2 type transport system permease protein
MPIHDQSYRRYAGGKAALGRSWTVIAEAGVRNMIRKRLFLVLLFAAFFPFIGYAVGIYFMVMYPQAGALLPDTNRLFGTFFEWQDVFVFFLTVYVGAGLIANDRRANALQIYLSKPLLRSEYIGGKAAILFIFVMLVTGVPAALLLFWQVVLRGSFDFLRDNFFLLPAIVASSLLQGLLATFTMLALSSLSKSSRYVAILFAGIIFFTKAIAGALGAITGSSTVAWMGVTNNLGQVRDVLLRLPPRYDTPWQLSLLIIIGVIVLSISVLERRVRGVEIVT